MYQPLVPCHSCRRHVRAGESGCPFCHAALPADHASRAAPDTNKRLARASAFLFATSLTIAGCSGTATDEPKKVATDAGPDAKDNGADDTGGDHPFYGAVPIDTGTDETGDAPSDAKDAGVKDTGGGGGALYGAPPP